MILAPSREELGYADPKKKEPFFWAWSYPSVGDIAYSKPH